MLAPILLKDMKLKKATLEDLSTLHRICVEAYSLHFHTHWEEGGLEWYLHREFRMEKLTEDVQDALTDYYMILEEKEVVGFLKTQENALPGLSSSEGMELVKMYILPNFKGKGAGQLVLKEIIDKVRDQGKQHFFLCVIDTNLSAIAFYKKVGFQFHSKMRLDLPYFKDELRGMDRMYMEF